MPHDQRASSVSSTGQQTCRPGQIGSCQEQQQQQQQHYHYHRREKPKSTHPHAQYPRRESSKDDTAAQLHTNIGTTQARRPQPKGRAHSAPLVPKSKALPLADDDEAEAGSSFLDADPGPDDYEGEDNDVLDDEEEGIADDPFFQRFSFDHIARPDDEPPSPDSKDSSTDHEGPLSPTSMQMRPRPDSTAEPLGSPLTPRGTVPWSESSSNPRMEEINIAVLGASSVGKSTFIQRAFDLPAIPTSPFTLRKMSIDGNIYLVRLIELAYNDLNLDDHKRICWPDTVGGTPVPVIDGAFTLYDVMNRESLVQVPDTLNGICKASIPFILVACKCDVPPSRRHIDPTGVDQRAKVLIGDITAIHTSCTAPDTQKRCVAVLLRAIVSVRNQHLHLAAARRRAHSSAVRHVPRQQGAHKHSRAASELPSSMMRGPATTTTTAEPSSGLTAKSRSQQHLPDAILNAQRQRRAFTKSSDTNHGDAEQSADPEQDSLQLTPKASQTEDGMTFEALVDKLLAQPMSKSDNKFQAIFLALYRKFAAPRQLLDGILQRFDEITADNLPQIAKAHHQMRHLTILEQWISQYPGDFAYPTTRKALEKFISRIRQLRMYSVAARELQANLDVACEDDDTDWALSDRALQRSRFTGDALIGDVVGLAISDDDPPLSPKSGRSPSASTSTSSSQAMLSIVESASRQARTLVPSPKVALTKVQWRSFMEHPDEVIAKELTRQDWTMFTSIRPRDLVRHVSLSASDKKKYRSLSNVQRMIDHFNHISYMCINLILLRDKPKHRALMLEKVMRVARELRKLNNYNSLGAILAGVNSSPVHRLNATKELIPKDVQLDFMKLEILMGSPKSHFAYRLAWENTPGERIPYLPLHRRDLVSASEGNRTFIGVDSDQETEERLLSGASSSSGNADIVDGDIRINWKKFEILGEGIVSIQRAQGVQYPRFQVCDEVRSLVVETEIMRDDDQLYDRSVALEPAGAAGASSQRKRFQWFQGAGQAG